MSSGAPHVCVVGGGLIGLSTALFLHERGANVTVIDSGPMGGGASRGNAGLVCSAILGPLPGPGAVKRAVLSLTKPDSPLRLHPSQLPRQLGWFFAFARACTAKRYHGAQLALGRLNASTPRLLDRLVADGARIVLGPSLVAPFHDIGLAREYFDSLAPMSDFGVAMPERLLDADETRALVPALTSHVRAGISLPGERSIDPSDFVDSMIELLGARGVELLGDRRVIAFEYRAGRVQEVVTDLERIVTDHVVLCPGAGMRQLARLLDLRVPIAAGQGYNVLLPADERLPHPVISEEAHAVATPLSRGIRLGGTMELGGDAPRFDQRRVDAIIRSMRTFLDLDWATQTSPWAGLRPMSPDGLPLIGRPNGFTNLVIAGGHGMYGLTLAPATGELVAQLVVEGRCDTDLSAFDPNRFRL